jgi:hypothetical protein
MAVNATVTAFVRGGTLPDSPAGICGIEAFRTETHLPIASGSKAAVRVDAVLRAPEAGVPVLMLDRYTESAHVLADKVAAYADLYARRVRDPALPASNGRTTIRETETVPFWATLYRRTSLTGLPPLAIVLTGAGPTALDNRIRTVADLSRRHWAPQRTTGYHHRADTAGDYYLDFTDRIPLVMTTLDRLQQHGPTGPTWFRIAPDRTEPEPLLQALTDTRTQAGFDQRQDQRDQAAQAAAQRREADEQRQADEAWARAEWLEKRKKKMKKLARLWDEAATTNDR